MRLLFPLGWLGALASVVVMGGCAAISTPEPRLVLRPVKTEAASASTSDVYYLSARTAIDRRDYAAALDALQSARARRPDDVRILNAFGVVYDKLGRFDLSARYYAQAKAADPTSHIVAENQAYSLRLQGKTVSSGPPTALAQAAPPPAAPTLRGAIVPTPDRAATWEGLLSTPAQPPVFPTPGQLASASPPAFEPRSDRTPPPARPGGRRSVLIVNASGEAAGADVARAKLVDLRWSEPRVAEATLSRRAVTTISYPTARVGLAVALAHSLPGRVRLAPCRNCRTMRLIIGADSLSWRASSRIAAVGEPSAPEPFAGHRNSTSCLSNAGA